MNTLPRRRGFVVGKPRALGVVRQTVVTCGAGRSRHQVIRPWLLC